MNIVKACSLITQHNSLFNLTTRKQGCTGNKIHDKKYSLFVILLGTDLQTQHLQSVVMQANK